MSIDFNSFAEVTHGRNKERELENALREKVMMRS
jgi:hypothetical protein